MVAPRPNSASTSPPMPAPPLPPPSSSASSSSSSLPSSLKSLQWLFYINFCVSRAFRFWFVFPSYQSYLSIEATQPPSATQPAHHWIPLHMSSSYIKNLNVTCLSSSIAIILFRVSADTEEWRSDWLSLSPFRPALTSTFGPVNICYWFYHNNTPRASINFQITHFTFRRAVRTESQRCTFQPPGNLGQHIEVACPRDVMSEGCSRAIKKKSQQL